MAADIAIKGDVSEEREQSKFVCFAEPGKRGCDAINADIEVIKHRIYEVRGQRLKSQIATSSWEAHARNHQRPGNGLGLNKRNNL